MKSFRLLFALCAAVALAAGWVLADRHGAKDKSGKPPAACCASEAKAEKKVACCETKAACDEKNSADCAEKACDEKACDEKACAEVAACCAKGGQDDTACAVACCVDAKVVCKDCNKCSPAKEETPAKKA
jgi:hypothetical protein